MLAPLPLTTANALPPHPTQAYWEAERDAEAKRRAKRQEAVLKRWTKLVQGLRIRQRLLEQYADRAGPSSSATTAAATAATADAVPPADAADEVRLCSCPLAFFLSVRHQCPASVTLTRP